MNTFKLIIAALIIIPWIKYDGIEEVAKVIGIALIVWYVIWASANASALPF